MTDVHVSYKGSDLPTPMEKNPLFVVELIEKDGEFSYSTAIAKFEETILQLFDKAIVCTHEIPQLEKYVMEQYFWRSESKGPFVDSVLLDDAEVVEWRRRARSAMQRSLVPLSAYLVTYDDLKDLVTLNKQEYVKNYEEEGHTTEEMKQEIFKHMRRKKQVIAQIPYHVSVGNYSVDCNHFRLTMANKCQELAKLIMDLIDKIGRAKAFKIRDEFGRIAARCQKKPTTVEVLYQNKDYIRMVPEAVADLQIQIEDMKTYYNILEQFQYGLSDEEFRGKWDAVGWPKRLDAMIETVLKTLDAEAERFKEIMALEQEHFLKEADKMQRTVATFSKHTDLANVGEIAAQVKTLQKNIKELQDKAADFNKKQGLFGEEIKNYKNVFDMSRELQPYASLWITSNDWIQCRENWHSDPFESLDAEEIERVVTSSHKTLTQLTKMFKDKPALFRIVEEIKKSIEDFRPLVPVVTALRNPGMKDRHWSELSRELGTELRPKETLNTLNDVYPLVEYKDKIVKICEVAGKEWDIESRLNEMYSAWEQKRFIIEEYRQTKTFIMKGSDEIQQQLDEHLNITQQQLSFSPFKAYFTDQIDKWESQLNLMAEILEQWLECQRSWLYLEPIFTSEDIVVQLPVLAKKFEKVDRTWRKIMNMAHTNPNALSFCTTSNKLLENFLDANKVMESIQKGLQDYLGEKRQIFARFYFLSDEELLEILSQSKDPRNMQTRLKKLFENIDHLEFQEPEDIITHFVSQEGESVTVDKPFQCKGNVEHWLGDIQNSMKTSVRQQIKLALEDYRTAPSRNQWVLRWPGQVVIAVGQIFWTAECEEALTNGGARGLKEYSRVLHEQLLGLVHVVQGDLKGFERINLGALITIELHSRDVVDTMVNEEVSATTDFQWVSQLRYYWEEDDCYIKQVDSVFRYGGEYLGNSTRLVITPLTDRIYLTLTGALNMFQGGAPAGPAGTGKTETVKDLAKALAKQCVVFNCQEGLDFQAMAKFFKGLAMAGAWACFDEFNRIDVEVLSVVAQQVSDLQQAAITRNYRIEFEGTDIVVDPTFAIFITMNPGYAGRTELPDNLKVLFRPVACMVPDYALIAEIRLFSFGYTNARELARKMVATFRLSSEQLSSQDHYDFGMRAVNTVISAAGIMKRENKDGDENLLLLRALRDSNLPKFLRDDIILFEGIISDLFPGAKVPPVDYGVLMQSIRASIQEKGLQEVEMFIKKCIQLYEITVLRHGLMLVGPTGAGKTSCYKILQKAMTAISGKKSVATLDALRYPKVRTHICNPKCITMKQLYGAFDESTHEWSDGILSVLFRKAAQDASGTKNWVMFDGPVDALWIESMNTVLDENKRLCLVSGEIIQMSKHMTIMFEVEDLAVASPATVSRCGMIYMEPVTCVGTEAQIRSWVARLPNCMKHLTSMFEELMGTFLDSSIQFVKKNCKEYVPTPANNNVASCFRVLDAFIQPYIPVPSTASVPKEMMDHMEHVFPSLFFFALIWTVGATTDNDGRVHFDKFLRQTMKDSDCKGAEIPSSPENPLVYDWFFDRRDTDEDTPHWVPWVETQSPYQVGGKAKFHEIIVPTKDTIRTTWLMEHLLARGSHLLCIGPTGTGKTLTIQDKLMQGMPEKYVPLLVNFSAQTTANMLQDNLMSKFEKRRKDTYGASAGKTFVIFVDDTNLPQKEQYGAQPPIELLRQYLDHGGWYNYAPPIRFNEIIDIVLICAMGPPGGGRNTVTPRFLRHFNLIAFPDLDDASIAKIFSTIMGAALNQDGFLKEIQHSLPAIIAGTTELFHAVSTTFLPTPAHVHYTFNLRDVAHVFALMFEVDPKTLPDLPSWLRLWCHECTRVFSDRLINDEDRGTFQLLLDAQLNKHFRMSYGSVVTAERLLYGDFLIPSAEPKIYDEISDLERLANVVNDYLDDYNREITPAMPLIMFLDAIEHVCRLCRTLRQHNGHALLLGIGGSGRRSLTRLAIMICEYETFQLEITKNFTLHDWREALKTLLLATGIEEKPMVFIFTDTQIVRPVYLEDVSNLLNSGDVPNLFDANDLESIYNTMRPICTYERLPTTKMSLYARFTKQVKANLHIVLAFSPIGEAFRSRIRMFPTLVNCCTIDWFSEWPDDALGSVARNAMYKGGFEVPEELQAQVVHMFVHVHQSVAVMSERYLHEAKRHNYVTPTSFLAILESFGSMLRDKRRDILGEKERLLNGLERLAQTEEQVEELQKSLRDSQPILIQTQEDIKVMMEEISKDKDAADEKRAAAVIDEAAASAKQEECAQIKAGAQAVLEEALPALDSAIKVLKNLKVKDIQEVAKYQNPPEGVKFVMEAVCKMKGVQAKKVGEAGKKRDDWWEPSRALLANAAELQTYMLNYDKDHIPEALIARIRPYVEDERFQPHRVKEVSVPCMAMCQWVHAMFKYYHVNREVEPKRRALAAAEEELGRVNAKLSETRASLKAVEDRVAELEFNYNAAIHRQAELEHQVKLTGIKLDRANRLISGLSGEKDRWRSLVELYTQQEDTVVGDMLLAGAAVAYLGPFTASYRKELMENWARELERLGVKHSEDASLIATSGDAEEMQQWMIQGLPSDNVSIENGIILSKASRWPLCIDPQGQANAWIKNMMKDANLQILKLSDKDFGKQLENSIRLGQPCLLENVGEELDPLLDPILLRQTFLMGNSVMIKIGDNNIPYDERFRLFLTTKLQNPHYPPETCVKVSLLNFFITPGGLEEQLLGKLVAKERKDLEDMKNALTQSNAAMARDLKAIQKTILRMLQEAEGDLLEQEDLIDTLERSKTKSSEIKQKVADQKTTEKNIDEMRNKYRPVAFRAATTFFCVSTLSSVDPMYQYSLQWFNNLFTMAIDNAERSDDLNTRLEKLKDFFTYLFYSNVCRSLFEMHKLMFSFTLCIALLRAEGKLDEKEWRFLLAGSTATVHDLPNPAPVWLTEEAWSDIQAIARALPKFEGFAVEFSKEVAHYKAYFDAQDAHRFPLHASRDSMTRLEKLIVLRCLRPDKVSQGVQDFVEEIMGDKYIQPPTFNLHDSYRDSDPCSPLIFILSPGADPMDELMKFAETMKMSKKLHPISLGQGQGKKAESLIQEGVERGSWVVLQNCHLAVTWMPTLEAIVEHFSPETTKREFRLWLTSMPSNRFPVSVLQVGIKMTNEPPKGLKANVTRSYQSFTDEFLDDSKHAGEFKKLLFGLCLFHAVIQERRKFGALGWNISYEFTTADLNVCIKQLQHFLDVYEHIPYVVIKFLTGQINYGGRVTDDRDRRCLMTLLDRFIRPEVIEDGYKYSPSGTYRTLEPGNRAYYLDHIRTEWPLNPQPEVFGLHENADITYARNETFAMVRTILSMESGASTAGGLSREEVLQGIVQTITDKVPTLFDEEAFIKAYPTKYEESMNTVLNQEAGRFNKLLNEMHRSLKELRRAIKGEVVLSQELEEMGTSMYNNQVPKIWADRAYPSLKALSAWVDDLVRRCQFIDMWFQSGSPAVFWISGFFFPQAFLTGTLQNFARKTNTSIDTISFGFEVQKQAASALKSPPDGVYITGLFMEGARWDHNAHSIGESRAKELFTEMPVVWLKPEINRKKPDGTYTCPAYKTLSRAGTLSTTGHSTNFVLAMDLPSNLPESHWVERGVACFCDVVQQ
eukprot:TRINITY_DN3847_c0_g1_i1.p1 TRINITY_DN3847_c0_g1~~TRINITY_DN3847_c0_g1_i1.p1  ORF type:complete len:4187 (-),score=787.17 TRINITY_DN3847_c0_g1_i1:47-10915(-)